MPSGAVVPQVLKDAGAPAIASYSLLRWKTDVSRIFPPSELACIKCIEGSLRTLVAVLWELA